MASTTTKCSNCGKLFYSTGIALICPDCKRDQELFKKQQQQEEYIRYENRRWAEEDMAQQEVNSIDDKIYALASNIKDTEDITRKIKLLIRQHDKQVDYVYYSINALGNPFEKIIKDIICTRIKDKINRLSNSSGYSFQRMSVKYFMPEFNRRLFFYR